MYCCAPSPCSPCCPKPCCPCPPCDPECCPPLDPCCPKATPPVACSTRLTKPLGCNTSHCLCCRPKWDKNNTPKFSWHVHYDFPCLPPVSCRYRMWTGCVGPKVDSNICASRFSSRCENRDCIAAMPDPYPCDPCPCHCCPCPCPC